ncbi:hypothetical protein [Chitinophaga caseinilytica]|uniref:hypothetical protein n=1 Tax=Chitinophaga caseinilytica TaxID=2267521 RepID=UPI003C2F75D0
MKYRAFGGLSGLTWPKPGLALHWMIVRPFDGIFRVNGACGFFAASKTTDDLRATTTDRKKAADGRDRPPPGFLTTDVGRWPHPFDGF